LRLQGQHCSDFTAYRDSFASRLERALQDEDRGVFGRSPRHAGRGSCPCRSTRAPPRRWMSRSSHSAIGVGEFREIAGKARVDCARGPSAGIHVDRQASTSPRRCVHLNMAAGRAASALKALRGWSRRRSQAGDRDGHPQRWSGCPDRARPAHRAEASAATASISG